MTFSDFWSKNRVGTQRREKCFYLLVGADIIAVAVLVLSYMEFKFSRIVSNRDDDVSDELRMSQERLILPRD